MYKHDISGCVDACKEVLQLKGNLNSDTNPDVKELLMASAVDIPDDDTPGHDTIYGAGRIDVSAILSFHGHNTTASTVVRVIPSSTTESSLMVLAVTIGAGTAVGLIAIIGYVRRSH